MSTIDGGHYQLTLPPVIAVGPDGYRALDEAGQKDFYYLLLPHCAFLEAAAQVTKSPQSKPNAGAAAGVAVIATGGLIAAWWDQITTWIGGFFS